MKFSIANITTKKENLNEYFLKQEIFKNGKEIKERNKKKNPYFDTKPFGPELLDLYRLHQIILKYKRTTVLEFGVGWSTKVMANALLINKKKYLSRIKNLRFNNPFQIHSVDNFKKYISLTKKKLSINERKNTFIKFSKVKMCKFNGRIATEYENIPSINPDLIYLDGPSQFNVKGSINNISTSHYDFMPMSCDILKIEHFLKPGTIIVIDGRSSNYRFLMSNFQRKWKKFEDFKNEQYILILDEPPLGKLNAKQIEFYFN